MDVHSLIEGLRSNDRRALSKCITLAESTNSDQRNDALNILQQVGPQEDTFRIAITGAPGAGKSTLVEVLGIYHLNDTNNNLAVLSIDPSSSINHGSILGDKTRMPELSKNHNAFIRPTASGNHFGGVAKNTRLAMLFCEAAGYKTTFIESVGVGQGETEVSKMVDYTILVINPGAGDELQGIKRGIMEVADLLIINKADGQLKTQAENTAKEYAMALKLVAGHKKTKVLTASALHNLGIDLIWQEIHDFKTNTSHKDKFDNRKHQMIYWTGQEIQHLLSLKHSFDQDIDEGIAQNKLPEVLAREILEQAGLI